MVKQDRRIQKTRVAIYEAFSSLLAEKKYNIITIQEIIDRANIGRSTFYSHFETKDELINSMCAELFEVMNIKLDEFANGESKVPIAKFLSHIEENRKQLRGLFNDECSDLITRKFKDYWNGKIKEHLLNNRKEEEMKVPIDFLVNHIISSIVEMMKWWINGGMKYTPEEMEQYLYTVTFPAIVAGIG